MKKMDYNKGNPKRRVYHLPLDGYTDQVFNALDFLECDNDESLEFQTQNRNEDDCCSPSSFPFSLSNSSSAGDCGASSCSSSVFSLSGSFLVGDRSQAGPSSLLSKSSSVNNESEDEYCGLGPSSLTFSFSNSSSVDDYGPGPGPSSLTFSLSNSSSVEDQSDCGPGPSSSFSLSNSSSVGGQSEGDSCCAFLPFSLSVSSSNQSSSDYGPTSLTFSLSNSSSIDDHSEDDWVPSSLPFWMIRKSSSVDERMIRKSSSVDEKSEEADTARLLSETDRKNRPSFGFQTFSEGKRFRKEVFENIPDSLYELSFRDIINEDLAIFGSVEDDVDITIEGLDEPKRINMNNIKPDQLKKKSSSRNDQIIARNQRMNSAVFLLKMFVPVPLRSKTKSKNSRKCSNILPGTSFDLIENTVLSRQISQRLQKNKSKGIDGFSNITSQKRLVGGKLLSCFCKMSDSQRYIGNALLNDGCNK